MADDPRRRILLDDLASGPSAASELFRDDEDTPAASATPTGSGKTFAEFVRTTPARPLTTTEKGLLTAVGLLVALLFAASLFRVAG
jgi:hypothetical protein